MHIDSNDETLRRYLDDIRQTAPLDRQEEQLYFRALAEKDKDPRRAARAREKLISANMRFVLKVAIQYKGCPIPLPDLVSEGAMGLVRAIESFDHSRGLKFISYAVWWIKAYITRAINENGSLIRLPANQHLRVRKALKDLAKKGEELPEDIRELIQLGERGVSFDSPLKSDTKTTYSEVLADHKALSAEKESEIQEIEGLVQKLCDGLRPRETNVIKAIFGIGVESSQTLREVGETLGISHERVRQLRDQAIRRIRSQFPRDYLREKFDSLLEAKS